MLAMSNVWHSWRRLSRLVPILHRWMPNVLWRGEPPPRRMSNAAFLQLVATINHPDTREAFRVIIVDLLSDEDPRTRAALRDLIMECIQGELAELLVRVLNERNP